jgi:hypothetical protein
VESNLRRSGIAIAALFIAGLGAGPAQAGGAVTTSLFLPLQGTVFVSPGPCAENVPLSGMVHVVSILQPAPPPISQNPSPPPVKLHFNMAGVMGTGAASGNTYVATGAQQVLAPQPPPISPQGFALQPMPPPIFQLEGTDSCAGEAQLPVNFNLIFDGSGHLLPNSTAGFGGQCSLDLPNCGGG